MSSPDPEHREEEETPTAEDEDTGAQVAPIVKLEHVSVTTGEENEHAILDLKSKLYRFDKDGNQWKERGAGTVKFLKHKETGKVRLVMRQSKTLKICANHLVIPTMSVQEHAGNDKSCVWHAADFADGELKDELFCIRFGSVEKKNEKGRIKHDCKTFMEMFQEVAESQQKTGENKDASAAAGLLEKLSVEDKKTEERVSETEPGKVDAEKKGEKSNLTRMVALAGMEEVEVLVVYFGMNPEHELGLTIILQRGFNEVIIETDAEQVMKLLSEDLGEKCPFRGIVEDAHIIMRGCDCSIQHIRREANICADATAKLGEYQPADLLIVNEPPAELRPLLVADIVHLSQESA
ncbi:unnamed protein product [Camellia sinensis]